MNRKASAVLLLISSVIFSADLALQAEQRAGFPITDFHKLGLEVVKELSTARTSPRSYAFYVKDLRKYFYGKELRRPADITILTKEGDAALVEAIQFLEDIKPLPALRVSQGMCQGARDHVEIQGKDGTVGHGSSEGKQPWERISRYGTWQKMVGENIAYGQSRARDVVTSLIIDDGVPGRGHRVNIFNPNFRVVGVAFGPHAIYGAMCVIIFAGEYLEKK